MPPPTGRSFELWISVTRPMTARELHCALRLSKFPLHSVARGGSATTLEVLDDRVMRKNPGPGQQTGNGRFENEPNIAEHRRYQRVIGTTSPRYALPEAENQQDDFVHHGNYRFHGSFVPQDQLTLDHKDLAQLCIKYLQVPHFGNIARCTSEADLGSAEAHRIMRDMGDKFPLLQYCIESLFSHVECAIRSTRDTRRWLDITSIQFLVETWIKPLQSVFSTWRFYCNLESNFRETETRGPQTTLINVLVEYNLLELAELAANDEIAGRMPPSDLLSTA